MPRTAEEVEGLVRELQARLAELERQNEELTEIGEDHDEFLRVVSESRGVEGLVRAATSLIQKRTGCEAVGIRLEQGEDYPYYQTRGFPQEFIQAENRLCDWDDQGFARHDGAGALLLACLCGQVLRGGAVPLKPFSTSGGSFWCNGATKFVASNPGAAALATRGRCLREGYESLALIPLRSGERTLGLLQLADRREDRFTPQMIASWERLAGYLAVALARLEADDQVREGEERYLSLSLADAAARRRAELLLRARLDLADAAVGEDVDGVLQCALDAAERLTGSTIGFFHFVDDDQLHLTLKTWSTRTLRERCRADGKGSHDSITQAGVWVDCVHTRRPVIHNDYASLPHRRGLPPGHAPVVRELVVPVLRNDKLVAIVGVGNKPTDYSDDDVSSVQELASVAMEAVARKRVEAEKAELLEQTVQDAQTKQRLLHEINHRVKNNLVALLGLLLAEQRGTPAPGRPWVAASADRMSARIRGLLATHEMLSAVEWAPLQLSELSEHLIRQSLGLNASRGNLSLAVSPSPARVSPRQASNLALVLNELATNTLKYALPGRNGLRVVVSIVEDDEFTTLEYRDDGPGYPDSVIAGAFPSVGLGLVSSLVVGTLRGSLTLSNCGGAVAAIRIRKEGTGAA